MDKRFLAMTPRKYYCSVCGKMHLWERDFKKELYVGNELCEVEVFKCPNSNVSHAFGRKDGKIIYATDFSCGDTGLITAKIDAEEFKECEDSPRVTYKLRPEDNRERYPCTYCNNRSRKCVFNVGRRDGFNIGFEYYAADYRNLMEKRREEMRVTSRSSVPEEEVKVETAGSVPEEVQADPAANQSLWTKIYSQWTPEQSVGEAWKWLEARRPTLKWAVPVFGIYAAYLILNKKKSGLTVNNVNKIAKEKLGFSLESLQNKKALRELMDLGVLCAGAYAAYKLLNKGKETDPTAAVEALEKTSQAPLYSSLGKKAERLLPIAASVIIVYVMTQQPKGLTVAKEKLSELVEIVPSRIRTYGSLIIDTAAERFGIDSEDEEQMKKVKTFAFLAGVVGIVVLLYGTKMLKKKDEETCSSLEESAKKLAQQILGVMKAMLPTAFASIATYLVTKRILTNQDVDDAIDVEVVSEKDGAAESERMADC